MTLKEVKKIMAKQEYSAESGNLIEKSDAIRKEIIKSLTNAKANQACKYNKSHRNMEYNVNRKVKLNVKSITIE